MSFKEALNVKLSKFWYFLVVIVFIYISIIHFMEMKKERWRELFFLISIYSCCHESSCKDLSRNGSIFLPSLQYSIFVCPCKFICTHFWNLVTKSSWYQNTGRESGCCFVGGRHRKVCRQAHPIFHLLDIYCKSEGSFTIQCTYQPFWMGYREIYYGRRGERWQLTRPTAPTSDEVEYCTLCISARPIAKYKIW